MKPCPTKSDCPCEGNPVGNFSSEKADQDVFLGFNSGTITHRPNPGDHWRNPDGYFYCADGTSQLSADLCAAAGAVDNGVDGGGPGGDGVAADAGNRDPGTLYSNTDQSCTVPCPNGGQFTYTIPAGKVHDLNPILVDRIAASLACKQANKFLICIGPLDNVTGTVGTGYFGTVKLTGSFAPYKWTATTPLPAGLVLDDESGGDATLSKTVGIIGTPTASGAQSFTLRATDKQGNFAERVFTITVASVPVTLTQYWNFDVAGDPIQDIGPFGDSDWGFRSKTPSVGYLGTFWDSTGPAPGTVTGKILKGYQMTGDANQPGSSGDAVDADVLTVWNPATQPGFTMFAWLKIAKPAPIVAGSDRLVNLYPDDGFGIPALGVFYSADTNLIGMASGVSAAPPSPVSNWFFIAYTYNNVTGQEKSYFNGVLLLTGTIGPFVSSFPKSVFESSVGQQDFVPPFKTQTVDEIGISMTAIYTAAQILALYNSGNGLTWPAVNSV